MIQGIGVDIVDIARMQQRIDAASGFRELVFSPAEITYCESKANKYESYAARFAAKEAFLKAVGIGIDFSIDLNQIEITNNKAGKPYFVYTKQVEALLLTHIGFVPDAQVSLSHSREQAIAFVLFNKN
ncbi:holo-ACP synthase [Cytophaga hutchinsonii]|jgi:holo-[acyl-carrier protein] synthase|uniref:Holo-[acyl-carrier-protein] synthase n=1 Tax=Cytophaga hutchinsonii (strain ATCC 33406 / DSM 1761 / CIP 103989 / NBRC 15051 / NCIMB 9469 / D465) TaxID=269798 RepID=ACPS_CYTH3|nr:holo-ACP synthase [Cytophaga hutchinsonii]Q11T75.1 RecName: Full=Holo-[acyl-carrier-protein] synthase; Short=Holo-ACP synthase; AltName: Full=4'-phosphopantetheinyl transferase AcpS [Cytophaga hutchinsonii ATCC 33406]ABG59389.1 holo-[acyl-carrier protein] synthase [Cytophaga hutchinsonii ATCC 33406]SFX92831.1 holo-[acyl-carrier-protein] synthase [Cytophaga hutchinsonii ATCC 33406]